MPLHTKTYDLEAEIETLESEMQEHAETQAEYPPGSDGAQEAAARGQQAERYRDGLIYQTEAWDADSVELAALTHGERDLMLKVADDLGLPSSTNAYVAVATRDAPYLEHDPAELPTNEAALKRTVARIPDLHPWFVDWVEREITELGKVDGETGNSYRALVQARRTSESQTETSG
jgi:hypothetical protein